MPVTSVPLFGGLTTLGSNATRLADDDTPMCQLTIRSADTAALIYFGNSTVTNADTLAHGRISGGEWHVWGPYESGRGIRPSQIFLAGTAGDKVLWSGFPA